MDAWKCPHAASAWHRPGDRSPRPPRSPRSLPSPVLAAGQLQDPHCHPKKPLWSVSHHRSRCPPRPGAAPARPDATGLALPSLMNLAAFSASPSCSLLTLIHNSSPSPSCFSPPRAPVEQITTRLFWFFFLPFPLNDLSAPYIGRYETDIKRYQRGLRTRLLRSRSPKGLCYEPGGDIPKKPSLLQKKSPVSHNSITECDLGRAVLRFF